MKLVKILILLTLTISLTLSSKEKLIMKLLSNFMILKNKQILTNQVTNINSYTNKEVVGRFMPENVSELFPYGISPSTNENENNFQELTKEDVPDVPIYFQG